jgi:molybdenum cofactor cytidylyltransferase
MKFGEIPVGEAEGSVLAHSVKHAEGMFKKGRTLSAADIALLERSGVAKVFAARIEPSDMPEDEAASVIARAIAGTSTLVQEPFTGRANLHAEMAGVVLIDEARVRELNRLHESLTLATASRYEVVEARQMVATVKIIPFAVPRKVIGEARSIVAGRPLVSVAAFKGLNAGLVITKLPQTKPSLIEKSEVAMCDRLEALGGSLGEVIVCNHQITAVRDAVQKLKGSGHHPVLVFGASAIVDRGDVIPAAVVAAGGEVVHLGMPVDPGNLMMLGRLADVPIIGVPSCARSPKINGFDWVLARIMAGIEVTPSDIMDMGAGGLLKEIPTRPSPREGKHKAQKAPHIAAIVLAAGMSKRMGANKLVSEVEGVPMVRRSVEAVLAAKVGPVIVVTGHEADRVKQALAGFDVRFVHNPRYAHGLSTSLKAGIEGVPPEADGAVVCLGDMPLVEPRHINKLVAAFNPAEHRSICVPVARGERGNPVLWGRQHFARIAELSGDRGARSLIDQLTDEVVEVAIRSDAVLADIDTLEALENVSLSAR